MSNQSQLGRCPEVWLLSVRYRRVNVLNLVRCTEGRRQSSHQPQQRFQRFQLLQIASNQGGKLASNSKATCAISAGVSEMQRAWKCWKLGYIEEAAGTHGVLEVGAILQLAAAESWRSWAPALSVQGLSSPIVLVSGATAASLVLCDALLPSTLCGALLPSTLCGALLLSSTAEGGDSKLSWTIPHALLLLTTQFWTAARSSISLRVSGGASGEALAETCRNGRNKVLKTTALRKSEKRMNYEHNCIGNLQQVALKREERISWRISTLELKIKLMISWHVRDCHITINLLAIVHLWLLAHDLLEFAPINECESKACDN